MMASSLIRKICVICLIAVLAGSGGSYLFATDEETGIRIRRDMLKKIRKQKEKNEYKEEKIKELDIELPPPPETGESAKDSKIDEIADQYLSFELPHKSKLRISGRKVIGMKYGYVHYKDEDKAREVGGAPDATQGFDMSQELQVSIRGEVGRKIDVNVDYNDAVVDKRDIAVVYTGYKQGEVIDDKGTRAKEDEIIEEVAFGDISLNLPQTEFIGYNKELFGLKIKAKYKNLSLLGIGSQTKGVTETKRFRGNTTKEEGSDGKGQTIADNNYAKRKYYRLYFSDSQKDNDFPIQTGEEEIYIQSPKVVGEENYTKNIEQYGGGSAETDLNFKKLYRGIDYTIDYTDGIITFKRGIEKEDVIAVDYVYTDGTRLSEDPSAGTFGYLKLIKDQYESLLIAGKQEVKSYYNLGHRNIIRGTFDRDFKFRVTDRNENVIDLSYSDIEIDYDNGIIKFKEDEPFDKYYLAQGKTSIYDSETAESDYTIWVTYYYRKSEDYNYILGRTVIIGSERITLDGKVLQKDSDYIIDYDIGFITLINTNELQSDSIIEITYEYIPFGGQFQQTLVGGRTEYDLGDIGSIGATGIYTGASRSPDVPNIYSTPGSVSVIDSDFNLKFNSNSKWLPVNTTVKGEVARSVQNPNTYGKAIVDNMESVEHEDIITTNKDRWYLSSNPAGYGYFSPNDSTLKIKDDILDNEDINIKQINEDAIDERDVQVLTIDYAKLGLDIDEAVSFVNVISKEGQNYSEKLFFEIWVYEDDSLVSNPPEISIRFGGIDEDTDGTGGFGDDIGEWYKGDPKTEDLDNDGKLGVGEDIGWSYQISVSTIPLKIGADNGRVDTQDLNANGILDGDDNKGARFTLSDAYKEGDTENGWSKYSVPLSITDKTKWDSIKQARITIKNSGNSLLQEGKIKIYSLAVIGNKWEKGLNPIDGADSVIVLSVNTEDNPEYESISIHESAKDHYLDLYKNVIYEDEKEYALGLQYENLKPGATAYATYNLPSSKIYDFSKYETLRFFVYNDTSTARREFFFQCGADENNYFEYTKEIDWTDSWYIPEIDLLDTEDTDGTIGPDTIPDGFHSKKGAPRLNNIKYMRVGIRNLEPLNDISGRIYVNDIFVTGVNKKDGLAYRGEVGFEVKRWGTLSGSYKHTDADFETITTGSQSEFLGTSSITSGQDVTEYGSTLNFNRIGFMPLTFDINNKTRKTPLTPDASFNLNEDAKIINRSGGVNGSITIKHFPKITGSYSRSEGEIYDIEITTNVDYALDNTSQREAYYGRVDYTVPLKTNLYSQDMTGSYKHTKIVSNYFPTLSSGTVRRDVEELVQEYNFNTNIYLFKRFNFKTGYTYNQTTEKLDGAPEEERKFRSKYQKGSVDSSLVIIKWLRPNLKYAVHQREDYNLDVSTAADKKDIKVEAEGDLSLTLKTSDVVGKFRPTNSLTFSGSYNIKDINSWRDVDASYYVLDKWFMRNMSTFFDEKHYIIDPQQDTGTGELIAFKREDTKRFSSRWNPLEFIDFTKSWTRPAKSLSTRLSYSKTYTEDIAQAVNSRIEVWPEIITGIRDIERMFFLSRFISGGDLTTNYLRKTSVTQGASKDEAETIDSNYRFRFFKIYDCSLNYKNSLVNSYALDTADHTKTKSINTKTWGAQIGRTYRVWRLTLRYDGSKEDLIELNTTPKWSAGDALSIVANADFNMPRGLKIPLMKRILALTNRLKVLSELKADFKKGALEDDNKNIYSFKLDTDYDLSSNFRLTLGSKVSVANFKYKAEANYTAIEINTTMSIVF